MHNFIQLFCWDQFLNFEFINLNLILCCIFSTRNLIWLHIYTLKCYDGFSFIKSQIVSVVNRVLVLTVELCVYSNSGQWASICQTKATFRSLCKSSFYVVKVKVVNYSDSSTNYLRNTRDNQTYLRQVWTTFFYLVLSLPFDLLFSQPICQVVKTNIFPSNYAYSVQVWPLTL